MSFKISEDFMDDVVTIVAILAIVFLAYSGVVDLAVLSIVAALGGYRIKKRADKLRR